MYPSCCRCRTLRNPDKSQNSLNKINPLLKILQKSKSTNRILIHPHFGDPAIVAGQIIPFATRRKRRELAIDVSNAAAGNVNQSTAALPDFERELVLLTAPDEQTWGLSFVVEKINIYKDYLRHIKKKFWIFISALISGCVISMVRILNESSYCPPPQSPDKQTWGYLV